MKIAILGWGSLIWDKRDLPIIGDWQKGGPTLRIEFSRISKDGRLTLVIDEQHGVDVVTRYAYSVYNNLNDAIASLQKRENNPPIERIGFINLAGNTERDWSRQHHPTSTDRIRAWAQTQNWDAVVWTALITNFTQKRGEQYSPEAAIRYFNDLAGETKACAVEYVQKAPPEVDTPFRRLALAAANSSNA